MNKGFYIIGRDLENSKTYIFGKSIQRFDTLEEAENERFNQIEENRHIELDIQILEVE